MSFWRLGFEFPGWECGDAHLVGSDFRFFFLGRLEIDSLGSEIEVLGGSKQRDREGSRFGNIYSSGLFCPTLVGSLIAPPCCCCIETWAASWWSRSVCDMTNLRPRLSAGMLGRGGGGEGKKPGVVLQCHHPFREEFRPALRLQEQSRRTPGPCLHSHPLSQLPTHLAASFARSRGLLRHLLLSPLLPLLLLLLPLLLPAALRTSGSRRSRPPPRMRRRSAAHGQVCSSVTGSRQAPALPKQPRCC
jgi:hypothetical protein